MIRQFAVTAVAAALLTGHVFAAVNVGDPAPDVSIKDQAGSDVSLKDYQGKKHVVLYFYPKDFTGGCTLQAKRFAEDYDKFTARDAVVIGVSADDAETHSRFCDEYKLPFTLLADTDRQLAKAFGVGDEYGRRSTFLIDKSGKVAFIVGEVKDIRGHNDVLLAELDKLRSDKSGPQVGEKAPRIELPAEGGNTWRLASHKGEDVVLLTFYRAYGGYQCPHCMKQAKRLGAAAEQLRGAGAQAVSVYPGTSEQLREFINKVTGKQIPDNPMVLDTDREAAAAYGVLKADGKGVRPATFVIDREGMIRWKYVGKSASDRPDMETVLAEVRKAGGKERAPATQAATVN